MCRYCGDAECKNGRICRLPVYMDQTSAAIERVQQIDPNFISQDFGLQIWDGQRRPAPVTAVWSYIKRRCTDGFTCAYCEFRYRVEALQVDHYVPWKQYIAQMLPNELHENIPLFIARVLGSDPVNLVCACASCNESKSDRDPQSFSDWKKARMENGPYQGALIRQPQPPETPRYMRHQKYSTDWQPFYN